MAESEANLDVLRSASHDFLLDRRSLWGVKVIQAENQEDLYGENSTQRHGKVLGGFLPRDNTVHLVAEHMGSLSEIEKTLKHEFMCAGDRMFMWLK